VQLENASIVGHHLLVRVLGKRAGAEDALPPDNAIDRAAPGKAHDHGGTQAERVFVCLNHFMDSPHVLACLLSRAQSWRQDRPTLRY
jgi:hypothetical protein